MLQEFRRLSADTLPLATIIAIRHPSGGGEAPALGLVLKEFLTTNDARDQFTLTAKAKEFLAYDPKPESEEAASPVAVEAPE